MTTRALVAEIGAALGRPIRLTRVPPVVLAALGLFVPMLRELQEMSYQWEEPFVIDDARFRRRFGDLCLRPATTAPCCTATGRQGSTSRPTAASPRAGGSAGRAHDIVSR